MRWQRASVPIREKRKKLAAYDRTHDGSTRDCQQCIDLSLMVFSLYTFVDFRALFCVLTRFLSVCRVCSSSVRLPASLSDVLFLSHIFCLRPLLLGAGVYTKNA